jgi:hypothetical protein
MMDAGDVDIKQRISPMREAYSVLKEKIKYDECGWSDAAQTTPLLTRTKMFFSNNAQSFLPS